MRGKALRSLLTGTASVLALTAFNGQVLAQEAEDVFVATGTDSDVEEIIPQDDDYLGEIQLGTSKREVQTQTAEALTTINQEEINDRQAGTVAELIDSVPGVTLVNGSTPQGSGINIRGFGSNSTLATSAKSCFTRFMISMPRSWWAISRPRKRSVTFTLSPLSMNFTTFFSFT